MKKGELADVVLYVFTTIKKIFETNKKRSRSEVNSKIRKRRVRDQEKERRKGYLSASLRAEPGPQRLQRVHIHGVLVSASKQPALTTRAGCNTELNVSYSPHEHFGVS